MAADPAIAKLEQRIADLQEANEGLSRKLRAAEAERADAADSLTFNRLRRVRLRAFPDDRLLSRESLLLDLLASLARVADIGLPGLNHQEAAQRLGSLVLSVDMLAALSDVDLGAAVAAVFDRRAAMAGDAARLGAVR